MTWNKRQKQTGKGGVDPYVGLPRRMVRSQQFNSLSPHAVKLLVYIASQYRGPGSNNGDLSATWATLKPLGWRSPSTLWAAKRELLNKGFIVETRRGRSHHCCLYAITWCAIDECNGKHNVAPTTTARNDWLKNANGSRNAYRSNTHSERIDEKKAA